MPRPFDDHTRAHAPTTPKAANLSSITPYPQLSPHATPRLYVSYQYNHFWPTDRPASHHDLSNPSLTALPPYTSLPSGNESSDHSRALVFPQPLDTYNPSGSFCYPPNLFPSSVCGSSPPAAHGSTLDPTQYSNLSYQQSSWSAKGVQVGSVDEYFPGPSHHPPDPSQQIPVTFLHASGDYTLEPLSGILGASYPCQWTEDGVVCNVMVQATRSHMNRHLHTDHGFGGSDTQQTRCRWAGCGERMQQGSIARHMVTCHLQAKVTCPMCSKKLSRQDVISKHQRVCPAAGTWR